MGNFESNTNPILARIHERVIEELSEHPEFTEAMLVDLQAFIGDKGGISAASIEDIIMTDASDPDDED